MKKIIAILMALTLCLTFLAACGGVDSGLQNAETFLFNLYKDNPELTPSDFDVVKQVMVNGVAYAVTWTADTDDVTIRESEKDGFYTVDVNEKTSSEIAYTLTATISNESGKSVQKTFARKIPAYKVFSYAEYAAAADGDTVVVQGTVIGIFSKSNGSSGNGIYIQDANNAGGYYVYGLVDGKDPSADLGIQVGMTIEAAGLKDTYSGLYEVVDAAVEILDSTIKTVEPVDYTDAFTGAQALSDASLVDRQSMLVTIKGVEITGQDTGSGYYKFALGGKESYVRISSSNNCITKDEIETFKSTHTANFGYTADVTGIVALYSGNFYLVPATVDAFTNFALPQRSDAEKAEMEVGNLIIPERVVVDTVVDIPATGSTYTEVTYNWVSDNACAVVDGETLTVTLPEEDATVTLTLTVTCGSHTESKTFTILVNSASTDVYAPEKVSEPAADTAYKFALHQTSLGKDLYFAGYMSGNYLATTDKADKAVDTYLEAVDGGFRIYFMDGDAKKYIDVYEYTAGKVGVQITDTPTCVYNRNAEIGNWVAVVAGEEYYLGTYKTYDTISASKTSYINAENNGVSQFPCDMVTVVIKKIALVKATEPAADTAYKFALHQTNLGKDLYFAGYMSGNYLATSDKLSKATDTYLEAVDGGFRIYFMDGDAKKYIDVYEYTAGKVGVQITDTPTCVYNRNAEIGNWVAVVASEEYYLGTYKTYDTISASKTSYITAENNGVSQFPCDMVTIALAE